MKRGYNNSGSNKFNGKLCVICNHVWEWDAVLRVQVKYEGFPTYGLERAHCAHCNKEHVYTPTTLQLAI